MKPFIPIPPFLQRWSLRISGIAILRQLIAVRRAGELAGEIGRNQEDLVRFGHHSSREFTCLAENLASIDEALGQVRKQAAILDNIVQDHDEDRALFSAFELYKKSVDLAHGCIGLALSQEEQMEQMEGRLLADRNRFAQTGLMFRLLVMQIRTEAARIDPENRAIFFSVAEEIAVMAQQMNSTVETAFSQLESIVQEAAQGREQLKGLKVDLHTRAQLSMKVLRDALEKIKQGLSPCAVASTHIAELLVQSRKQTSELVTSLQYQDIVRQQLEHVNQGFDDIARHLHPRPEKRQIDLGYVHQAVRVQQTHLGSSRRAIENAGAELTTGFQGLLAKGTEMVAKLAELENTADRAFRGVNVAALFKRETDNPVEIAGLSESTNRRITRLLERIEKSVRIFSTEIRRHEFEVQLVALNAQIAAARVPDAAALVKLAEETANLSWETARLTKTMSEQLAETLLHLNSVRKEADEGQNTVSKEKATIAADTIVVSGKLAALNERIQQSSNSVAQKFARAFKQVQTLLPTLQFPSLIQSCFAPAAGLCTQLLSVTARYDAVEIGSEGSSILAAHRGRYTMQQERENHSNAMKDASQARPPDGRVPVETVELFDPTPVMGDTPTAATSAGDNHGQSMGEGVELF